MGEVRDVLTPIQPGAVFELGSGPGFARPYLPGVRTSDLIRTRELDCQIDAAAPWPFRDGSLDGVVLFDVLHHLSAPSVLFREATRALRPGGRLVFMEPYVSPLSYPFYRWLHVEGLDTSVDPFALEAPRGKDPFDGNQATPRMIFDDRAELLCKRFPLLRVIDRRLYCGFSYLASGGYARPPLLPTRIWSQLFKLDVAVPSSLRPLLAFRMLICMERIQGDCDSRKADTFAGDSSGPSTSLCRPASH